MDIYFYVGWFWRSKCNKNWKKKLCSVRTMVTNVMLPYMSHIIDVITVVNCSL